MLNKLYEKYTLSKDKKIYVSNENEKIDGYICKKTKDILEFLEKVDYIKEIVFDECIENLDTFEKCLTIISSKIIHGGKIKIVFKDKDKALNILEKRDFYSKNYIQKYIFQNKEEDMFEKSWDEKAKYAKNCIEKEEYYKKIDIERILEKTGFYEITEKEERKNKSILQELEYSIITAVKKEEEISKFKNIYVIQNNNTSMEKFSLDKDLREFLGSLNINFEMIILKEQTDKSKKIKSIFDILTDIEDYTLSFKLEDFTRLFKIKSSDYILSRGKNLIKLDYKNGVICNLILNDEGFIHFAEIYKDDILLNRLEFSDRLLTEERFSYSKNNKVNFIQKLYYNKDGSVSFEYEKNKGNITIYTKDRKLQSLGILYEYVFEKYLPEDTIIITSEENYKQIYTNLKGKKNIKIYINKNNKFEKGE